MQNTSQKELSLQIQDKIWMSEQWKWQACTEALLQNKNCLIAVWFEETYNKICASVGAPSLIERVVLTRQISQQVLDNQSIIFAEHYPLHTKEEELFKKLNLSEVVIYSSLDEPLLKYLGGNLILTLAKQLGFAEDEVMENELISSAVKNAQEDIASKVFTEQLTNSQADWLMKNLTA
jgi:hypothetical protein